MGVVDGSTEYGDIIDVGQVTPGKPLPKVAADPNRRALSITQWMSEFFKYHVETGWSRIHAGNDQRHRIGRLLYLLSEG